MGIRQGCRLGLILVAVAPAGLGCGPPDHGAFGSGGRVTARPDGGVVIDAPVDAPVPVSDAAVPALAGGQVTAPWRAYLVGNPEGGGSADQVGGAFTVQGSGRDIYDTLGFTFVAQPFSGDGEIIAQVTGLRGDNLNPAAKAGVVFLPEGGLANPASPWAGTFVTPGNGAAGQWRADIGMAASSGAGVEVVPGWVRLSKVGSQVTFFYSPDGSLWIRFGSASIASLGGSVLAGLAVSAHDDAAGRQLVTASFDNVKINGYPSGQPDAGQPGPGDGGVPPSDGRLPGGPLPAPWAFSDLGATLPGAASYGDGTFHLTGGGRDIWQRADNGAFIYQRIAGDAEIRADILGVQAANQHAKAGLMFRASLDTDDLHAMWLAKPNDPAPGLVVQGLSFQWRPMRAVNARAQDHRFWFPPQTMRLVRKGGTVEASLLIAPDRWFLVSRQALELPETIYVGLAVTAHDQNLVTTGVFQNVVVVGQPAAASPDAGASD